MTLISALAAGHALDATPAVVLGDCLLGAVAGLALGLVGAEFPLAARFGRLPVRLLGSLPGRALAVLAVAWMTGAAGLPFPLALWLGCFPVAHAVLDTGERLPRGWLEAMRGFGASRLERLFLLRLPAAVPALGHALAPAYLGALIGVLAADFVHGGAGAGGWLRGRVAAGDVVAALAGVAGLAVTGGALAAVLHWLPRRLIRWPAPGR